MRRWGRWILLGMVVGGCLLLWGFSLANGEHSAKTSGAVWEAVNQWLRDLGVQWQISHRTVRKTAHFLGFFALGVITAAALRLFGVRRYPLAAWIVVFLVACADEGIQRFVPGRGPSLSDVLLDVAGGSCGILAFLLPVSGLLAFRFKQRKKL